MKFTPYSMRISLRFTLVLAVLVPTLGAVTLAGIHGLRTGRQGAHSLYEDHLRATLKVGALESALQDVHSASLELLLEDDPAERRQLQTDLANQLIPAVQSALGPVFALSAGDSEELAAVRTISSRWATFESVLADKLPTATTTGRRVAVQDDLDAEFHDAIAAAKAIVTREAADADAAYRTTTRDYDLSIELMLIAGVIGLLLSIATVVWLIRSVLPRTLSYSSFATQVRNGDFSSRLLPQGTDELAQLGRVLDDLAERLGTEERHEQSKLELSDALQLVDSEYDADQLLKQHLEALVPEATFTVLNRDNVSDQLTPVTPIEPTSPLAAGLAAASPRSCLAIRTARVHISSPAKSLLPCATCSGGGGFRTCIPLLVGGEVIGSVLATHEPQLSESHQRSIRDAVTQAAPVIGNLRNLAGAELRAATDSLTGLPNRRAVDAALHRMTAQAARGDRPMAVLMCDLDHFKNVNDRYGHERGDDVLVAAANVIATSIRAGDFAGRYGGEEFIVLLPDTDKTGTRTIADKLLAAVSSVRLSGLPSGITMSIGAAVFPVHARDAESLQRAADQALYAAKTAGRNRVEICEDIAPT